MFGDGVEVMQNFSFEFCLADLIRTPQQKINLKIFFLKPYWGHFQNLSPKSTCVVKDHDFPFLKWCDTSQSVQQFGCYTSLKWKQSGSKDRQIL